MCIHPVDIGSPSSLCNGLDIYMPSIIIHITINNSLKCDLPEMVSDVVLTDPGIADVTDDSG